MGGVVLQLLRGGSGALAVVALGKGLDFSTDGHGHGLMTYFACYGAAAAFVIAAVVLSIVIYRAGRSPDAADPCGDPNHRRAELITSAKRLEGELERFPKVWWPAVSDPDFDGETFGHFRTTHADAMQKLLYAFAFFFSAAWIYEKQCKGHHGRRRKQVLDLVGEVYLALGSHTRSDTDIIVDSLQVIAVAERSTSHEGEARAQPIGVSDFNTQLRDNPTFAADFEPFKKFLTAAEPNTDTGERLVSTQEAVKRVREKLT